MFIKANGEISVYAVNAGWNKLFGYSVLPVDVFGPYYHVFLNTSDSTGNILSFLNYVIIFHV